MGKTKRIAVFLVFVLLFVLGVFFFFGLRKIYYFWKSLKMAWKICSYCVIYILIVIMQSLKLVRSIVSFVYFPNFF